jgi:maltose-binding protein MalE
MLSSIAGFITLERVYMATAVIGLIITLLGYLDKRRAIQEARKNDNERLKLERELNQATIDSLKYRHDTPAVKKYPEVSEGIKNVLEAAKD